MEVLSLSRLSDRHCDLISVLFTLGSPDRVDYCIDPWLLFSMTFSRR